MPSEATALYFGLFNEIGIIEQLSRALLEARLPEGLIAPHFTMLNHLVRVRDGRTPLDLARAFQVPKTSLTHTLAGLERRGLVEVRPNPQDGRSKTVWITAEGRALREAVIAAMGPAFDAIAREFPADQVAGVLPALTALRRILDAGRDGPA
jgi:DNA-binding MarR family transcriptional regulator